MNDERLSVEVHSTLSYLLEWLKFKQQDYVKFAQVDEGIGILHKNGTI